MSGVIHKRHLELVMHHAAAVRQWGPGMILAGTLPMRVKVIWTVLVGQGQRVSDSMLEETLECMMTITPPCTRVMTTGQPLQPLPTGEPAGTRAHRTSSGKLHQDQQGVSAGGWAQHKTAPGTDA